MYWEVLAPALDPLAEGGDDAALNASAGEAEATSPLEKEVQEILEPYQEILATSSSVDP